MTGFFRRPSLSITLDGDRFPYEAGFLRGPAVYRRPVLREYLHEVLHFWQLLSQGFIANLSAREWQQLLDFERTGSPTAGGGGIHADFQAIHPGLGFSAWNLHESLCRFWDLHIIGAHNLTDPSWGLEPLEVGSESELMAAVRSADSRAYTSEQFDTLMQNGDSYAAPYRFALSRWGSWQSVTLFPLIGYFALQSPAPVEVFAGSVERLVGSPYLERVQSVELAWQWNFELVRDTCAKVCYRLTGNALTPGWRVIAQSSLASNPVYREYLDRFADPSFRTWAERQDLIFATPGHTSSRDELRRLFPPPVTLFHDGRWIIQNDPQFDELADAATEVDNRYRRLLWAQKEARLIGRKLPEFSAAAPVWAELDASTRTSDLQSIWQDAAERSEWETAATAWRVSHGSANPEAMRAIYELRRLMTEDTDRDETLTKLEAAATSGDPVVEAWAGTELGHLLAGAGRSAEAAKNFERVLAMDHPFHSAHAGLALGKLVEHVDSARAKSAYERAIRLDHPDQSPKAAVNLALLSWTEGDLDGAKRAYERALAYEHPDADPKAAYNLALLLIDEQDFGNARTALLRAWRARDHDIHQDVNLALSRLDRATS